MWLEKKAPRSLLLTSTGEPVFVAKGYIVVFRVGQR